jgi:hypothetical protein
VPLPGEDRHAEDAPLTSICDFGHSSDAPNIELRSGAKSGLREETDYGQAGPSGHILRQHARNPAPTIGDLAPWRTGFVGLTAVALRSLTPAAFPCQPVWRWVTNVCFGSNSDIRLGCPQRVEGGHKESYPEQL